MGCTDLGKRSATRFAMTALVAAGIAAGCRPEPPQQYRASDAVAGLTEDLSSDEERALFRDLQIAIGRVLRQKFGTPQDPRPLRADERLAEQLQLGAAVYARRCASCHGVTGDGMGPVAKYLDPKPRDYRQGIFKFTSTPYGSYPRRADLVRTVRQGVVGTAMPSFQALSRDEVEGVVEYVRQLAMRGELENQLVDLAFDEEELDPEYVDQLSDDILARWQEVQSQLVMPVTNMPKFSEQTVANGQRIFLEQACNKCHGKNGRGGMLGNVEVGKDAWGNEAAAADLTSGMFHGGGRPVDLYRRIYSGINGTPMPGFANSFQDDPNAIWHLVHFIKDLGEQRRRGEPPEVASED